MKLMWNGNNCFLRFSVLFDTSTVGAEDAFTMIVFADEDNLEESTARIITRIVAWSTRN